MNEYIPKEIEPKWQKIWEDTRLYKSDLKGKKPRYMALSMFNYPSGAGIHVGHAMTYTISDVKARFKRQQGYESYHPVGWDAFGLPAENYAIKAGVSPQKSMAKIIPSYHKQYKAMGWSNDWDKEISTHEPEYYKWTQWIFSQLHKKGLAYQDTRLQWWCDKCQTVLANEQVIDGKCWRHDNPDDPLVKQREIKQWFLKITEYADELLDAVDALDWTESVKTAQKNWIGKSVGAEITFSVKNSKEVIKVFTTRPDTLFGATFLVVAPESELVSKIVSKTQKPKVEAYIKKTAQKSEIERQVNKDKTGVFTGAYAINPATKEEIPIWVADYVLAGYGTGAIMAVPAHDQRDHEFARKHNLAVQFVIEPTYGESQGDESFKKSIYVILRNPKTKQVVVLDWGPRQARHGGQMLIGGGVEEGESFQDAAAREIVEETGYKNFKLVGASEFLGHGYFYSNTKNKNMHVSGQGLLYDLVDEEQVDTALDAGEQDKFKVTWQPMDRAAALLDDGIHEAMYRYLVLGEVYAGEGLIINSQGFDGMESAAAREQITTELKKQNLASEKVTYKMRDWSVSRQRYWGAPIPIINCQKCGQVLVADKDLPVVLPELTDFKPSGDGRSALARAKDWVNVKCPKCGGPAERETDTLDTYLDSSWYMLRYFDPHNSNKIFDSAVVNKWLPVDFYNGADHATAHLLYARFICRFFNKIGLTDQPEPFKQMLFNGKVSAKDGGAFSKSKGTGADPLDIINSGYGADALRLYLMFAAPLEQGARWDPQGVPGTYRFLGRLWNFVQEYLAAKSLDPPARIKNQIIRATNQMVKKITEDIETSSYNTAIASAMGTLNRLSKLKDESFGRGKTWQQALDSLVACAAPFAPHITEELWQQLGHKTSVHLDSWPKWDEKLLVDETANLIVQINGRVRANVIIPSSASEAEAVKLAQKDPRVKKHLAGKQIQKTITVKNKLVNFVAA